MGEARVETRIERPADEVWAVIGNFGNLDWMPNAATCELDGDDLRVVHTTSNMRIVERQLARDDAGRTLTYGVVDGDLKLEVHEVTITVTPDGPASDITLDVKVDDAMVKPMTGSYRGALEGLKATLES